MPHYRDGTDLPACAQDPLLAAPPQSVTAPLHSLFSQPFSNIPSITREQDAMSAQQLQISPTARNDNGAFWATGRQSAPSQNFLEAATRLVAPCRNAMSLLAWRSSQRSKRKWLECSVVAKLRGDRRPCNIVVLCGPAPYSLHLKLSSDVAPLLREPSIAIRVGPDPVNMDVALLVQVAEERA